MWYVTRMKYNLSGDRYLVIWRPPDDSLSGCRHLIIWRPQDNYAAAAG